MIKTPKINVTVLKNGFVHLAKPPISSRVVHSKNYMVDSSALRSISDSFYSKKQPTFVDKIIEIFSK